MAHENEEDELQQQLKKMKTFYSLKDLNSVPTLPREIVIEILLRLPVECLLRCMSVCKSWYSLISDSRFVKSHLNMSTNNYAHHRLMLTGLGNNLKSCSLYEVMHDKTINSLELYYPCKKSGKFVCIVGSCRGLLCLYVGEGDVYIWNPSTRRSNRLPHCGLRSPLYGFGYDESVEDHKVVALSRGLQDGTRVKMYSLKSAKWKKIDDFPGAPFSDDGKFLNGALHWATRSYFNSVYSWKIISLNLATKSYGEILLPVEHDELCMRVEALGERLFLIYEHRWRDPDAWLMTRYGDPDSWVNLVTFQNRNEFWKTPFPCFAKDGKILLKNFTKHVLYDVRNGSFSNIKNYGGGHFEVLPWTFVESLVSPGGPQ